MEFIEFVENIDVINVSPKECILFRFPTEEYRPEDVQIIHKKLQEKFPTNTIVLYPDDTSLEFMDKEMMLDWLDKMKEVIEEL